MITCELTQLAPAFVSSPSSPSSNFQARRPSSTQRFAQGRRALAWPQVKSEGQRAQAQVQDNRPLVRSFNIARGIKANLFCRWLCRPSKTDSNATLPVYARHSSLVASPLKSRVEPAYETEVVTVSHHPAKARHDSLLDATLELDVYNSGKNSFGMLSSPTAASTVHTKLPGMSGTASASHYAYADSVDLQWRRLDIEIFDARPEFPPRFADDFIPLPPLPGVPCPRRHSTFTPPELVLPRPLRHSPSAPRSSFESTPIYYRPLTPPLVSAPPAGPLVARDRQGTLASVVTFTVEGIPAMLIYAGRIPFFTDEIFMLIRPTLRYFLMSYSLVCFFCADRASPFMLMFLAASYIPSLVVLLMV